MNAENVYEPTLTIDGIRVEQPEIPFFDTYRSADDFGFRLVERLRKNPNFSGAVIEHDVRTWNRADFDELNRVAKRVERLQRAYALLP